MRELIRRLQWRFHRDQFERDLEEEMRHHLALKADEEGDSDAAQRQFGNTMVLKESSRAVWTFVWWEQLAQDVRYGLRSMGSNKLFTAMAVLSLALGIGANTAVYSFMDAMLLRALPVSHPEQLVVINWHAREDPAVIQRFSGESYRDPATGVTSGHHPYPAFELMRDSNRVFSGMFAFDDTGGITVSVDGYAEITGGQYVSGDYFRVLGTPAAAGRVIDADDDRFGAPPVVVISYNFWVRRFASNPAAIGQSILLNNSPCTVIGVASLEFFGVAPGGSPDLFIPLHSRPNPARFANNKHYWVQVMGRLRPDTHISQAQTELEGLYHRFVAETASNAKERTGLPDLVLQEGGSGVDALRRRFSKTLYVLMTMVGLMLAMACINIANLLLARAAARRREIAVRLGLGAGRLRVIRQLLTESLLLGLTGGLLGALLAVPGIRFLQWLIVNGRDDFHTGVELDWHILGFTLAITLLTSLLFGLVPAIQTTRVSVAPALKETRASSQTHGRRRGVGLSQILLISQIAISLLIVIAAGLFVRTLINLQSVPLGFNRENVLLFGIQAGQAGYRGAELVRLYEKLQKRFAAIQGVRGASLSDWALVSAAIANHTVAIAGRTDSRTRETTFLRQIGPEFFSTMQIPVLLGREIDARDSMNSPRVALVNEIFVKDYFASENPVGRRFRLDPDAKESPEIEIVGLVKATHYDSLTKEIPPTVYIPYTQDIARLNYVMFQLRTAGNPLAQATTVRHIVNETAPQVPVFMLMTQADQINRTMGRERTLAELCSCFAALTLAVACIGLYGTLAYSVSRRTNEIGIRMAVGASAARIQWTVLQEVLALSTIGIAIGLAAAWTLTRFIESFLFGMKARDPLAITVAIAILMLAGLIAGYAPAWRASRIDPMVALRHE